VAHVVRCFTDSDVTHVEGRIDPLADPNRRDGLMRPISKVSNRRIVPIEKRAKDGEKEAILPYQLMTQAVTLLREGRPARLRKLTPEEREPYRRLGLLTKAGPLCHAMSMRPRFGQRVNRHASSIWQPPGRGCHRDFRPLERTGTTRPAGPQRISDEPGSRNPGSTVDPHGYRSSAHPPFLRRPKDRVPGRCRKARALRRRRSHPHRFEKASFAPEVIKYETMLFTVAKRGGADAGKFRLEGKDYVVQTATSCISLKH